jgi:hypothetical protein
VYPPRGICKNCLPWRPVSCWVTLWASAARSGQGHGRGAEFVQRIGATAVSVCFHAGGSAIPGVAYGDCGPPKAVESRVSRCDLAGDQMPVEKLRAALTNQKLTRRFPGIGRSLRANPGAQLGYRMSVADERKRPRATRIRFALLCWRLAAALGLEGGCDASTSLWRRTMPVLMPARKPRPPQVVGERHIFAAGRRAMEKC